MTYQSTVRRMTLVAAILLGIASALFLVAPFGKGVPLAQASVGNTPATGAPTIIGTAQVGKTLTADTSGIADTDGLMADTSGIADTDGLMADTSGIADTDGLMADTSNIADEDGLDDVWFTYQWLADDADISGATGSTYTLANADEGKTVKVGVSFTDDKDNEEMLTSGSTDAVAAVGARAQQLCAGDGYDPLPTEVDVEGVPIVVESTIDEYFVVYVRYDLDADSTVYLPVSVTLGQAGTTTLSENVAALPKERYQVHKHLVADPADVDGDCIDDITELADPVGQNPVNSAATLALSAGALTVPDQDIFEALSLHGTYAKFFLFDMETDSPGVYFMNTSPTGEYKDHRDLMEAQGIEWDRAIRGQIAYNPDLIAPDGSQGIYSYRLYPFNFSHEFSIQERSYRFLAASLPLLNHDLVLHISNDELPYYQDDFPLYEDARINLVFDEDMYAEVDFQALNTGEGYGLLRVREADDRPHPKEIVVYEALPHELPRVAGIVTTAPQTPLSHINLRAVQDGVPNAFIRDALDNADIEDLIDSYVHYAVTEGGWTLRAATPAEVDAHYAASRPDTEQTPQRDLSVTQITVLGDIDFDDWTAFGVKAANVAVLGTLGFPDGTVPDGFAVPFYFYDEFMKHNEFYDDIEEMLADPDFQSDFDTQEKELKALRKDIKKGETPQWIIEALQAMHATYPEGQSLRYRSSTNNEDLPGFSGAGLYDSKTQDPEETEEDGIDKSIKGVWASLWNFRAFTEREFHRIDHRVAAMGVLVHPNYSDELANGVAVSFDPIAGMDDIYYGIDDVYYVNTQLGEDLVTNPEAHSVPEEILLYPGAYYYVVGTSNQMPPGQLLLRANQLTQLRRYLEVIHDDFKRLYKPCSGEPFAMEIEFKITSENILAIKQARPWVFNVPSAASAGNNSATGAPRISGKAQVGETLTADTSCIKDTDGLENATFSYQWRADGTAIQGATDATYTLVEVDEGKAIRVRVSFTDDAGDDETLTSSATAAVAATPQPNSPATGVPTISGTAQAGETLTVSTSGVEDADGMTGAALSYQWVSSDGSTATGIREATGATYTLVADDIGKTVTVRVKFTDDRGFDETLTSAPTAVVEASPNIPATGLPSITGAAEVGETLSVFTSGIQDANGLSGATFSYQWVSNDGTADMDIEEVTSTTYTLVADDIGKTIKVRVSFTDDGGNEETLTSAPTAEVEAKLNIPATGLPTISGKAQVGETLTAHTSGIADPNGLENANFGYQWLATDTAIDGATVRAYTLAAADKGNSVKVRVSFTDDGGNEETLTSAAREPVLGDGPPGAPRNLTATAGDREITLSWEPPDENGNAPVKSYRIEWRIDGEDYNESHWRMAREMIHTKIDLANGVTYVFRVKAENGDGNSYGPYGPASEEVSATPTSGSAVDLGTPVLSDTETLHHGMVQLDWQDIEDAGWYVVQYYHVNGGEWLDLPAVGVDIAFHGSSAVVSNLHGLSWLRVRAMSCAEESEWSQIEQLFGTKESDWEGVPVPEVAEGDEIGPCSEDVDTPDNSPATGAPAITGTVQVGETLTADTTGIADPDGLENASFSYQWLADDGTTDTEITDATAQTYTPSDADAGKSIKVRVSFIDDAGNEETLTGAFTDTIVTWSATLTVGEDTSVIPKTSGYSAWGMDGTLSTDTFTQGGATCRVQALAHRSDGLVLVVNQTLQADFTLGVGNAQYHRREGSRPSTMFQDAYWWEAPDLNWSAGDAVEVSLTLVPGSDASLPELPLAPPTAWFRLVPETHNGVDAFTFRLHFSEAIATGREAFRDHSFEVTGGSVTGVERVNGLNRLWEITVAPDPTGDVTIALPAGVACEVPGAICTADGRPLHNRPEFTVAGPEPVSEQPPDGEGPPADELTAVWSATMTVEWVHWGYGYYSTSSKQAGSLYPALFEVDGTTYTVTMIETAGWMYIGADRELPFGFVLELDGARFASGDASYQAYSYGNVYQWRGTDLSWSTGDTVKIRMLGAVDETTAGRAVGAPVITGTAQVGRTLTVDTSAIADPNGLSNVQYEYQWTSAGRDMAGADGASLTLTRDERDKPIGVRVSFTDDAGNRESLTSAATAPVIAAPLGECRRAGPGPEPRPVEVAAVPVVVESTAEKYYVLYVLHGRDDGTAVKIPVSVTLGEAGSTTLAEELPALPAERYRVEEYLVADPGDVDGDCIDDVTELAELGAMNPMNRAPEVRPVDGAAAIPDHETFEALSAHLLDLEYVKFHLDGMDTDRPVIFFQNTETHTEHLHFERVIEAWLEQNRPSLGGDYMRGEIVYHPNVVARDGSLGVYRFEFLPHDNHDFATIAHAHEILAASMPVLEDNLMYYPIPGPPLQRYHEERALYDESRIRVLFEEDIFPDVDYIALNRAEGYGFLRVMSLEERPNPRDVVIYETLPNELSRVAGIITSVPQTPLSHINLRAVQDGVPNAFIRDALDNADIEDLIDSYVHYAVTEGGWTLRAATPAEVDAHYAASRPAQTQTPERDLSVTQITALGDIEFGDWTAFGVKAANVAVLGTLGFPDGTVPNGFAVPFYFYDEFMKHNEFYDDIEEMLADPDFQSDFDTQEKELKKLRKDIKKGETPEWIIEALEDMHATYPEGQSLRYRSSTNNEDLPGFSGAGLYDSKTQDPEETEEDGIDKSIKGVWASLWNFRAFTEREFHRIDHRVAAMGVLVHPNYSDELANGVAVSFDPFGRRDGSYYVNTQLGEDLVTNPEAHSAPEEMLLHPDGTYIVTARSNQVPAGQLLMSDAQLDQLRRHLEAIHDEFEELYGIESGGEFAMEIDFKITSDNILSIKQARPWVFSAGQASSGAERAPGEHSNRLATGAPAIDGSARVGETLTVDIAGIADADGLSSVQYEYQWLADDAEITGATGSTYTLVAEDEGKAIKVQVSFTDDADNEESLTSGATDEVSAKPNSPATGAPTISGTAQVGETLAADTSGIADADGLTNAAFSYQWLADDTAIQGAMGLTYTLAETDEGKAIKVEVNFNDDAGNQETLTSVATDAVAAAPQPNNPATGAPTITGTVQVGETLTANTSGIADEDGLENATFGYQWLADDAEIAGATGSAYTLAAADEGKAIKVEVTFIDDSGNDEALTSVATDAVAARPNSFATGAPTISGTAQVGETLTANTSGIADADGLSNVQYEYQWLADDAEIAGATNATYTPADTDEGKAIKVQVSFTDDAGNGEALTSAATDAVAAEPSEPPSKPKGLEATSTHDSVTLTWDDPQDESITGYVILRRIRVNDEGGEFSELVADTGTAATTYTDDTVAASTTYTYRIKAINEHGTSERSRWVHIDTPAPPVPDKPTGLSATATHDQVVLTWDDPGDDSITGYVILRRLPGVDPEGQFDELVADTGKTATTYTDTSVAAETRYTYRIKAINEHGTSERSRWVHIDTPAAP